MKATAISPRPCPRSHIVLASIEKLVPTLEDVAQLLRVLARSATGQEMSVYTTLSTGPRRADDPDGPGEYHVVLLDNGRSSMLGGEFRDMLRCIRCGACMNHCPVYHAVGGHAYGWVYPGPMGAVLTPSLIGIDKAGHLPNASTFCGRCEEVCPVRIPLPRMMRSWREREFERHLSPATVRSGLAFWAFFAKRPAALRPRDRDRGAAAGLGGPRARTLLLVAARVRLDPLSRFPGAAGRDLPIAVEASQRPPGVDRQPWAIRYWAIRHDRARPHLCDASAARSASPGPRRRAAPPSLRGSPVIPAASCRRAGNCRRSERLDLFARMVEAASGTTERVASATDVPAAVATFLRGHNLPLRVRRGDDPRSRFAVGDGARARNPARPLRRARSRCGLARFRRGGRDRHGGAGIGAGQSDHAQFPARCPHRGASTPPTSARDFETVMARLRERYGDRHHAAHGQHDHRPVALGGHRADADARRPRSAQAARDRGGQS